MNAKLGVRWRFAALAGVTVGLAVSPAGASPPASAWLTAAMAAALAAFRPRRAGALPWLAAVALLACLAGLGAGAARLRAIDAKAISVRPGTSIELAGAVTSTPRRTPGGLRFIVESEAGRISVQAPPAPGIEPGRIVTVAGTAGPAPPWLAASLEREGAAAQLNARTVQVSGRARQGLAGALDSIRRRAEAALERGTSEGAAALLRGFVLGQDDEIAEPVREEFRRSGLAHVLAVSGQNVMLLVLLATPILTLAGLRLRQRLIALALAIAIYVPVAGAGASIQRAGVMGAAGLVAALAGRPRARWYALLLAAAVTLAINPRATGDIGWQLSFAAVAGLLVLAHPLARILGGTKPRPLRRLLAEGAAMTVAATLATAPLAAHHFEVVSLTALPANLVALPAIPPAMWLGMLAGALGQLPGIPVEPLTWLGGLCAGFIGWTARAFGGSSAQLSVSAPSLGLALALTAGLLAGARLICLACERRGGLRAAWRPLVPRPVLAAAVLAAGAVLAAAGTGSGGPRTPSALSVRFLDVGQGDATLLQPRASGPVLVDTGPPGGGAAKRLGELRIDRLAAIVLTHDDLDHSGALPEVLAAVPTDRLVTAGAIPPRACETAPCPPVIAAARGTTVRSGRLRLDVLWPPLASAAAQDDNSRSLVIAARSGTFDVLLTGDAEAEAAAYTPVHAEVLKVAHHGSADAGLAHLLERTRPQLAVIPVGEGNPFGHPAPETLSALAAAGVPTLTTMDHGEVLVEARGNGWSVE